MCGTESSAGDHKHEAAKRERQHLMVLGWSTTQALIRVEFGGIFYLSTFGLR